MARARTGTKKKRQKQKRAKKKKRSSKGASKARAQRSKKAPKGAVRRRRAPRITPRTGPVQLWLPLQMPLGLLGGVAAAPPPVVEVEEGPTASIAALGQQDSLFD